MLGLLVKRFKGGPGISACMSRGNACPANPAAERGCQQSGAMTPPPPCQQEAVTESSFPSAPRAYAVGFLAPVALQTQWHHSPWGIQEGHSRHYQWAGEASCRLGEGPHTPPWDSLLAHQPGLENRRREAHTPGGRSGN